MTAARSFEVVGGTIGSSTALAVGFLLITAYLMGTVAKQLHFPKLTGYLAAGLIAGDSVLALLPEASTGDLRIFTGVAVSLIALTAGTELEMRTMRPLLRTVGWISAIASLGTIAVIGGAAYLLRPLLPFMHDLDPTATIAMAAVLGVVISANSPAVVVALRTETDADGPLCRTVLGVVVVGDLLVILAFTAVGAVAAPLLGSASDQSALIHLVWHVGGSLVVGAGVAGVLWLYLRYVAQSTALFVVALCFVVAEVGARIGLDPLLVALSAGILVRNVSARGDALHEAIEGSSLPVYLVFFAAAGASIHLDVLLLVGVPALLLALVRAASFLGLSRIATRIAGADPVVHRWVGFGLLPQAGLALALALLMIKTFPAVGEGAGTLVLGIVALNEMVAPVLYRFALVRSGETGRGPVEHSAAYPLRATDSSSGALVDPRHWDGTDDHPASASSSAPQGPVADPRVNGQTEIAIPEALLPTRPSQPRVIEPESIVSPRGPRTGDTLPPIAPAASP
ncbi:MAG: cation:proton antiporter, partial [Deltaproteobacteria bacterium]|nr:cation:proton antiporter [Nannocystaceae bacterium]